MTEDVVEKRAADFFAGIGLATEGLERAGWKTVYAVDHDPQKKEIYSDNFDSGYYKVKDVKDVCIDNIPDIELAHASFPCTDTSIAGGREGIHSDGESSSYWKFIRVLRKMKGRLPHIVTIENVEGLLTSGGGDDLEAAIRAINNLGYSVDILLIDASHFVPQSRVRLFVIGKQREEQDDVTLARKRSHLSGTRPEKVCRFIRSHPNLKWNLRDLPKLPESNKTIYDVVDETDEEWWPEERSEYLFSQMYDRHKRIIEEMMKRDSWSYGTVFRRTRKRNGKRQSTAELRIDGLAGCLRTPKGGSARQILVRAGKGRRDARLLNARECARLMGVDDFTLDSDLSLNAYLWGFGDAVCSPVMEWLAEKYLNPELEEIATPRHAVPSGSGKAKPNKNPDNNNESLSYTSNIKMDRPNSETKNENLNSIPEDAIEVFESWMDRHEGPESGLPYRGRNYAALVTLNRLLEDYNLDRSKHKTPTGSSVKRLTHHNVSGILESFGETRDPLEEAGRTSRGTLDAVEDLLGSLQNTDLDKLSYESRYDVLERMMEMCVEVEQEYHERARVEFEYRPSDSAPLVIGAIINAAGKKRGAVAQHLVGAKLDLRLENESIPAHSAYTADDQTGRRGDFNINDTVFHITVSPKDSVYEKCESDVNNGFGVYLLVPEQVRTAAKETVENMYSNHINVKSIESFVGQNIDEIAEFSESLFNDKMKKLIKCYNERVDGAEANKSIMIEMPPNLR